LKILALETSSQWCSAALWLDGRSLWREELAGQRHSELILPMVDALLREAGMGLDAMDAVAFGAGPGSFTGLRIACGVTQGLAFARGLPVVGVSTLLAVAHAGDSDRVVSCLDARMGEVYFAAYERDPVQWRVLHPPQLWKAAEVPLVEGSDWLGAGSGFAEHGMVLAGRLAGRLAAVRPELHPHARDIASLAVELVRTGATVPAEDAQPIYIRDRVALTVEERNARKAAESAPAGSS
jgi:tRNA threonylcarbamoyladenosine biosynthesis protein TsaB